MNLSSFLALRMPKLSPAFASGVERARLWGRRFGVIFFIAVIGTILSFFLFWLMREEVNMLLARQLDQAVIQEVSRVQLDVTGSEYLLNALSELLALHPETDKDVVRVFVGKAGRSRSVLTHVYEASVKGEDVHIGGDIYQQKDEGGALWLGKLDHLNALIRDVAKSGESHSTILDDRENARIKWLVMARAVGVDRDRTRVLVGVIPLSVLFSGFLDLQSAGKIANLEVIETGNGTMQVLLRYARLLSWQERLMNLPEVEKEITFEHNIWLLRMRGHLHRQALVVVGIPYLELCIGFLLTFALGMYVRMGRIRSAQIAAMAESLRETNEELREKVTQKNSMALALMDSEQRYRDLFENAGIGICELLPNGTWLKANASMAQMLGYESVAALLADQPDQKGRLFVDGSKRRKWFTSLEAGHPMEYEVEIYTRDLKTIWVRMGGYVECDNEGKPLHYECTMYDVSERLRVERALMQAKEQADFANRSKSEFLANMSHELRTPLNAIIGFAEIIKDQLFGVCGVPQYVEYARDIYDSGDLLLSLINDILDMSKIEAGKRTLMETTLDMDRIVEPVMRLVAARAKLGKIQLNAHVPRDLPGLRGEEKAMKQILTNLLTNAIKFTPEGGQVALTVGVDSFGAMQIMIEDTGIGIAPEDLSTALAPFGQIESAMSRKHQGTGLGLPLTKALVELHGGVLDMQSEVGQGTKVTLLFPAGRVVPIVFPSQEK